MDISVPTFQGENPGGTYRSYGIMNLPVQVTQYLTPGGSSASAAATPQWVMTGTAQPGTPAWLSTTVPPTGTSQAGPGNAGMGGLGCGCSGSSSSAMTGSVPGQSGMSGFGAVGPSRPYRGSLRGLGRLLGLGADSSTPAFDQNGNPLNDAAVDLVIAQDQAQPASAATVAQQQAYAAGTQSPTAPGAFQPASLSTTRPPAQLVAPQAPPQPGVLQLLLGTPGQPTMVSRPAAPASQGWSTTDVVEGLGILGGLVVLAKAL